MRRLKKLLTTLIIAAMIIPNVFGAMMLWSAEPSYAEVGKLKHEKIDNTKTNDWLHSHSEKIKMTRDNLIKSDSQLKDGKIKGTNIKASAPQLRGWVEKFSNGYTDFAYGIKDPVAKSDKYDNVATFWFQNCGNVWGSKTAAKLEITHVEFGERKTTSKPFQDGKSIQFVYINEYSVSFGGAFSEGDKEDILGHIYGGTMYVEYTVTVYSYDTGKPLPYPYGMAFLDVDQRSTDDNMKACVEKVYLNTNYFKSYTTWKGCQLIDPPEYSDNLKWAKFMPATDLDASAQEHNKSSFFAVAKNSPSISVQVQVGGNMAQSLLMYSEYTGGNFIIEKMKTDKGIITEAYSFKGVKFRIYSNENCKESTKVGDDIELYGSGKSPTIKLPAGTYWVKEISGNKWYDNGASEPKKITIEAGGTKTYKPKDPPKSGTIGIIKTVDDKSNGGKNKAPEDLSSIKFNINLEYTDEKNFPVTVHLGKKYDLTTKTETNLTAPDLTAANITGTEISKCALVTNLPYANYTVEEVASSMPSVSGSSYSFNAVPKKTVKVNDENQIVHLNLVNTWDDDGGEYYGLKIEKTLLNSDGSENTTDSKKDYSFDVYDNKACTGDISGHCETDENGIGYVLGLEPDKTYYVKEDPESLKDEYKPVTNPKAVTIDSKVPPIEDKTEGGITYHIYKLGFENKKPGGSTTTITEPEPSRLKVIKTEILADGSKGTNVSGIRFDLYNGSTKIAERTTVASDSDRTIGIADFSDVELEKGETYTIREIGLDGKHISSWAGDPPSRNITITGDNIDLTVQCTNVVPPPEDPVYTYKVDLIKEADESLLNNSYYSLNGITYSIYSDPACTRKLKNNSTLYLEPQSGKMKATASYSWTSGNSEEIVYVKEDPVPANCGFERDNTVYTVRIRGNGSATVNGGPLTDPTGKGSLTFTKLARCANCGSGPEEHDPPDLSLLSFTLTDTNTGTVYGPVSPVVDSSDPWKGTVQFSNIPYGKYRLEESGTENIVNGTMRGMESPMTVTVRGDEVLSSEIVNILTQKEPDPFTYYLNITKTSSEVIDSPRYNMSGIKYGVYRDSSCSGTPFRTITLSGSSASASGSMTPYVEETVDTPPDSYPVWIKELSVPEGTPYEINDEIYEAEMVLGDPGHTITADDTNILQDDPKKANLNFNKKIYTSKEGAAIPGTEHLRFTLTSLDSTNIEPFTAEVVNGKVSFTDIPAGSYVLTEQGCEEYETDPQYAGIGRMENETGEIRLTIVPGNNTLQSAAPASAHITNNNFVNRWDPYPEFVTYRFSIDKRITGDVDNFSKYTLDGITYSIYTDENCSSESEVGEIVLTPTGGEHGEAHGEKEFTLEMYSDEYPGEYRERPFYIKENDPPEKCNVKKDDTVYRVIGRKDQTVAVRNGNKSYLEDDPEYGHLQFEKVIYCESPGVETPTPAKLSFTLTSLEDSSVVFTSEPIVPYTGETNKGLVKFTGDIPLGKYMLEEHGLEEYEKLSDDGQAYGQMVDMTGSPVYVSILAGDNKINFRNLYENYYTEINRGGITITKQTNDSTTDMSVFHVTVTNEDTSEVVCRNAAFSSEGVYKINNLKPGTYRVHEVLTETQARIYVQPEDQVVTVSPSDVKNVNVYFENECKKTVVRVVKISEDDNVEDIAFSMSGTAADGRQVTFSPVYTEMMTIGGQERGVAVFEGVLDGTYTITEAGFPETGYVSPHTLNSDGLPTQTVVSDGINEQTVTFINHPVKFELNKTEILEDGTPTSDPVRGAEYRLYKFDGQVTAETTEDDILESSYARMLTDENGHAETTELSAGTYWLYETDIPDGYIQDKTVPNDYPVQGVTESRIGKYIGRYTINADNTTVNVSDTNQRRYGSISFDKVDNMGLPVEGAEFTLCQYDRDQNDPVNGEPKLVPVQDEFGNEMKAETDRFGSIRVFDGEAYVTPFRKLKWGTYYLVETKVPKGYKKAENVECVIGKDTAIDLYKSTPGYSGILDQREEGKVELFKYDKTTEEPLNDITFDLYTSTNELVAAGLKTGRDNNGDGEADGDGKILYEGLEWGAYYFKETATDNSHTLDSEPVRFSINRYSPVNTPVCVSKSNTKAPAQIVATVKMKADDFWEDHGDPTFFVILENLVTGKLEKRPVTFDKNYIEKTMDGDGYVSKSVTFPVEASTDYTLVSVKADRYVLDASYDREDPAGPVTGYAHVTDTLEDGTKTKLNVPASQTGRTTFVYTKNDWSVYGDETSVTNIVKKNRTCIAISASWVGDSEKVEANLLYEPDKQLKVHAVFDDGSVRELEPSEYTLTGPLPSNEAAPQIPAGDTDRRWPGSAGTYSYTVSATIGGTTRTDILSITVLPPEMVKLYFHNGEAPDSIHISNASGSENISGEPVDYIDAPKHQKFGQIDPSKYAISWPGHTFIMWSKSPDEVEPLKITDEITGVTHFYAIWDANIYKIIYNDNQANASGANISDVPETKSAFSGRTVSITNQKPKADKGYTFGGWNTAPGGSGTAYGPGTANPIYSGGNDGETNLVLYAQWTPHSATLKYDANEDEGTQTEPVGSYAEIASMQAKDMPLQTTIRFGEGRTAAGLPTKTGYVCTGWNTKSDGTGDAVGYGEQILKNNRDLTETERQNGLTLYAQWEQLHLGDNGDSSDAGNLSWAQIQTIGNSGIAADFFAEDFTAVRADIANDGMLTASTLERYTKEAAIGGNNVHTMIAGFDHDAVTGGGTGAITFMTYEAAGSGAMERGGKTNSGWNNSSARTLNIRNMTLGDNLGSYLESVDKKSVNSSGTVDTTSDTLFLPSVEELYGQYKYTTLPN